MASCSPWSLLSVAAGIHIWMERTTLRGLRALTYGFPLLWCAVTFILFSLSKNKQEYYIAPLYPLAAVLLAGIIDQTLPDHDLIASRLRTGWQVVIFAIALVFLALGLLFPYILPALIPHGSNALRFMATIWLLWVSEFLVRLGLRGRLRTGVSVIATAMWAVFLLAGTFCLPALEPLRPVKAICRNIQAETDAGRQNRLLPRCRAEHGFLFAVPVFSASDPPPMPQIFRVTDAFSAFMGR